MSSRLALVGCRGPVEGPWTIAKGNESRVEIFGLGQAEGVKLELETPQGLQSFGFFSSGIHVWPDTQGVTRYRVCKQSGEDAVQIPTTVRILLSHQSGVRQ